MYATLFEKITPQTLLLTPNQRLAAWLQQAYADFQIARGIMAWPSIPMLALNSWYERLWQQQILYTPDPHTLPTLLTPEQASLLWQQIIQQSSIGQGLLRLRDATKLAMQAWQWVHSWQLDSTQWDVAGLEDVQAFLSWVHEFEGITQKNNWLDPTRLPVYLLSHLPAQLPHEIYWIGFDELSPLQQHCLQQVQQQGVQVTIYEPEIESVAPYVMGVPNQIIGYQSAAIHAHAQWQQDPHKQMVIVIPELHQVRTEVVRSFNTAFHQTDLSGIVNIAGGEPLATMPVIAHALLGLRLVHHHLTIDEWTTWLTSPFLKGGEQELTARSRLAGEWRQQGVAQVNLSQVLPTLTTTPLLQTVCMQLWAMSLQQTTHPQLPAHWVEQFVTELQIMGWPGERHTSSHEYQAIDMWRRLLLDFNQLAVISGNMTVHTALQLLQQQTGETVFQIKSGEAPIQVMGLLEAAGLQVDELWILDLHDGVWPQAAEPNPFIPLALQRQLNMPHASADRELQFAKKLMARLCQQAGSVILSYPMQEQDRSLTMSPLLRGFEEITWQMSLTPTLAEQCVGLGVLEKIVDVSGPTTAMLAGGSTALKYQAACPFRAFAEFRLGARAEITETIGGFSALTIGNIIHDALEKIWETLQSQQTLLTLSAAEVQTVVSEAVDKAIKRQTVARASLGSRYIQLERKRLIALLTDWLTLEAKRAPFVVLARERKYTIKLNQLSLTIRVDRVDQLTSGAILVLDYKTGSPQLSDCLEERPNEPQLPLYALSVPECEGVAFAKVRGNDLNFTGVSAIPLEDHSMNGVKALPFKAPDIPHWSQLITYWRQGLTALADELAAGYAAVAPKLGKQTCQQCHLQALCRIHE